MVKFEVLLKCVEFPECVGLLFLCYLKVHSDFFYSRTVYTIVTILIWIKRDLSQQ